MHYAFDKWMDREFPGCPFERYADDAVIHCDTEAQARHLWAALAERLGSVGLELHPVKTKVVYCKDTTRRKEAEHTSFDFLGYTFRGRVVRGPRGFFVGFNPAMSDKAMKAKGKQIRDWHLDGRSAADLSILPRRSIPRCEAGSTTTGRSTVPGCIALQSASTSTSSGGRCRSSNDCGGGGLCGLGLGWRLFGSVSPASSPTGPSSHVPQVGLREPGAARLARRVLRGPRLCPEFRRTQGSSAELKGGCGL